MIINGVNVQKIIEPQQLGVWNNKIIYICYGKFGYYLRYDAKNYSMSRLSVAGKLALLGNTGKILIFA